VLLNVVQGCILSGTSPAVAMTEGWIYLGGELLKVSAATGINTTTDPTFTKVTTFKSTGLKQLQSGANADTYEQNRGILNGVGGTLNVLTGDRYKDQFDEWKTFDITGTNANLISNSTVGGGGTEIDLATEMVSGHFRYKIVGKTVYWSLKFVGIVLQTNLAVGAIFTIIIRNLPFAAKVSQSCAVRLNAGGGLSQAVSGNTEIFMDAGSDRMFINRRVFDIDTPVLLNRVYEWDTTPSMAIVATGSTNISVIYNGLGNGIFEIE